MEKTNNTLIIHETGWVARNEYRREQYSRQKPTYFSADLITSANQKNSQTIAEKKEKSHQYPQTSDNYRKNHKNSLGSRTRILYR